MFRMKATLCRHSCAPCITVISRAGTLVEHGFHVPAAKDNRPLKFEEWNRFRGQTVFVSATPAEWELEQSGGISAEQVVRPTGLIDPPVEIRLTEHQVDNLCMKHGRSSR